MNNDRSTIDNAQLPEGYQQTEVGVIPEDWDVKSLSELSEKITVGIASAATHAYRAKGIPLIRNQNIKPNKLDDGDILYITEEYESRFKNKRLKEGDLLTARTGYPGTTCIVPEKFESAQSFTTLITRSNPSKIDCQYLSFFINSDAGQSFFDQNQIGGGQKNVNAGTLKKLLVPFPEREEQKSIAQALSDVDALITALEKTIAKKRNIKTATMQQLLTGKKRLPGFGEGKGYKKSAIGMIPEDWDALKVKDVAPLQRGFDLPTSQLKKGDYPVVYSNGVMNHHSNFMVNAPGVVTGRSGTIGNVHYVSENYWPHNTTLWVTEFIDSNPRYIFYLYKSIKLERFGTGSGVPTLNRNDVHDLVIAIPKFPEQRSIATVLSDMDEAIAALETRLTKTHALKQGMMQQLLTGKIRLKIEQ